MLSAATGYKYSAKDIIKKVNCVMTDRTFNLRMFDSVFWYMRAELSPTFKTCNMHMLMIIQQKAQKVF